MFVPAPLVMTPPATVHVYPLPALFAVEYVWVLPTHTPTAASPFVLLVITGFGFALTVIVLLSVPAQPFNVTVTPRLVPVNWVNCAVTVALVVPPTIVPPAMVQLYVAPGTGVTPYDT